MHDSVERLLRNIFTFWKVKKASEKCFVNLPNIHSLSVKLLLTDL